MTYVSGWTLRDYVEQTPNHKLVAPLVLVGRGSPGTAVQDVGFRVAHDLDGPVSAYTILLVEQEDGSMATVPITR